MRRVERVRGASHRRVGRIASAVAVLLVLLSAFPLLAGAAVPAWGLRIVPLEASGSASGGPDPFQDGNDTTPPVVTITSPAEGTVVHELVITLAGTASDDVGVSKVLVSNENAAGEQSWTEAHGTGTWSGEVRLLREGSNRVYARAVDSAGNLANASVTVILDLEPYRLPGRIVLGVSLVAIALGAVAMWRRAKKGPHPRGREGPP